jgi:hypothetical protein
MLEPDIKHILERGLQELPTKSQINTWQKRLSSALRPADMDEREFTTKIAALADDLDILKNNWPTGIIEEGDDVDQKMREITVVKWAATDRLVKKLYLLYPTIEYDQPIAKRPPPANGQIVRIGDSLHKQLAHPVPFWFRLLPARQTSASIGYKALWVFCSLMGYIALIAAITMVYYFLT